MIGLVCSTGVVGAQAERPVLVEWRFDAAPEGGWTVGDRIPLQLRAAYPAELEVILPELPQEWGTFEVQEQTLLAPVENEDGTRLAVREATVTLWAPGDHTTPSFAVRVRDTHDQLYEVPVQPLSITVASVLSEGETEKRDLKAQVSLPYPPRWPWVLGGLSLAVLLGIVGWLALKRWLRRGAPDYLPLAPLDTRSPEEIAYSELDRIEALDLPGKDEMKRHYILVSDCMRAYVQGRHHIPALDRTTHELVSAMRQSRINRAHVDLLHDLLTQADLVKFAKSRPAMAQARATTTQARHIVERMSEWANERMSARANGRTDEKFTNNT